MNGVYESSVANILNQRELKWIFVGGKGGVGKTTCSCCLAVLLSRIRENVLILSTDPAHNLSDAFRQKFSRIPTLVNNFTNLYAMEVDPTPDEDTIAQILPGMENDNFVGELSTAIPGIDEAMSFAEVMKMVQTMDYSCVVFDTAPTGHTLRLLQLPSTMQKGLDKLMSLRSSFGGIMSQLSGLLGAGGEGSGANSMELMLDKMSQLREIVERVNHQFKQPELTTFLCVCIPEFLSLYETERLVQELAKFEIDVHNIIINQVIFAEDAENCQLLKARVKLQQKYLDQYHELYDDFHITKLPLVEDEVRGTDKILEFAEHLETPYKSQGNV